MGISVFWIRMIHVKLMKKMIRFFFWGNRIVIQTLKIRFGIQEKILFENVIKDEIWRKNEMIFLKNINDDDEEDDFSMDNLELCVQESDNEEYGGPLIWKEEEEEEIMEE